MKTMIKEIHKEFINSEKENSLKSIVREKVSFLIDKKFAEFNAKEDNIQRIKKIVEHFDVCNGFFKISIEKIPMDEYYHNWLLENMEPSDEIKNHRFTDLIFENWVDFIIYNNHLSTDELANNIVYNLYNLGISYKEYLYNYYEKYSTSNSVIRKYFEAVEVKFLEQHFYNNCNLCKDTFIFSKKELDLSTYKLFLKISTSYELEVEKKDIEYLKNYFRFSPYDEYPDKIVFIHSIIKNVEERLVRKNDKGYNVIRSLNKNQLRTAIKELRKELFVPSTNAKQVIALFKGNFDYLMKYQMEFNSKFHIGLFWDLINSLSKDLFKVNGIYKSLDTYKWLIHNNEIVSYKVINNKRPKNQHPNSDIVDNLIYKLKNPM
jgi:hypothetical protein